VTPADLKAADPDTDPAELTYTVLTPPAHGELRRDGVKLDIDATFTQQDIDDGLISYAHNGSETTDDTVGLTLADGQSIPSILTLFMVISPVNDAPVGVADSYETDEDVPLTVTAPGVLDNDSDVEDDGLTTALASNAANGTVALNDDGSFTYTPNDDYFGVDSFTYTVSDGDITSDPVTVTITVNPVNDGPLAGDDEAETDEGEAVTIDVLGNDSDVDGTLDATTVEAGDAENGTVVVNADGSITYTPNANFAGDDTFTYTVGDNDGAVSNEATVTVTVNEMQQADPLRITSIVINDGSAQRSNIETITVTFSDHANIEALRSSGQLTDAITLANGAAVPLDAGRFSYDAGSNTLVIDLTQDGVGGSRFTMLTDGRYTLSFNTALLQSAAGGMLLDDADSDDSDGAYDYNFHRLLGDFDGDRVIGSMDFMLIRPFYYSRAGDGRYSHHFDMNGDGRIDRYDLLLVRARFGKQI